VKSLNTNFIKYTCDFPKTFTGVRSAIDCYGHFGDKFITFLKLKCNQASRGKLGLDLCKQLLHKSKAHIQIAHVNAASKRFAIS
jgi:hypothetical protein